MIWCWFSKPAILLLLVFALQQKIINILIDILLTPTNCLQTARVTSILPAKQQHFLVPVFGKEARSLNFSFQIAGQKVCSRKCILGFREKNEKFSLSFSLSVCLSVSAPLSLSVCLSVNLSLFLSFFLLFVRLSIHSSVLSSVFFSFFLFLVSIFPLKWKVHHFSLSQNSTLCFNN